MDPYAVAPRVTRLPMAYLGLEGRAPPMSRLVSVCLCAVMAFVAVSGVSLLRPVPALAASGTLTMETPLHESPDPASPLIALMSEGAVVSIDGPPVDGFYPVTAGDLSGWMRGETLSLTKDEIAEPSEEVSGTPEEAGETIPLEQEASAEPVSEEPVADPAATDPALTSDVPADPALSDPAAAPLPNDLSLEPAPEEPVAVDPAIATEVVADPAGEAAATEAVPEAVVPEPTPDPNVTPIPVAEAAPVGPASAASDLAILLGPGPEYGLITTVPMGSAVEQTGHMIDGYVSVQSGEVTGWAAVDQLAPPGSVTAAPSAATTPEPAANTLVTEEPAASTSPTAAPAETPTPEPTPEPAPVGPASVVVDMPIRSGPGPGYGLIFTVPLGSTVEQTGDLVDGYISVQYKEVIGWAAREEMGPPIDMVDETLPEETAEPVDTKTPKPGSGVAYTTVDLSLRAGPSANEEPIVVVPAGSRVVLTGVMEGEFQRVTFKDDIGWISNEFLATPEDPAANGEGGGRQESYSDRQITRIIYQAADRYDQSRNDMLRVARCESNLDPYAVNPSGSYGLFQFIRSTWKSTPYGDEDIFDPQANANAAAWMWSQGRKSEWVCQ